MKSEKKKRFPSGKFGKSFWINGMLAVFLLVMFRSTAYAVENTKVVTGTKRLLDDLSKVLIIVGIPVGIVCIGYFGLRMSAADEQDKKGWKNRILVAIIGTIIVVSSGAILKALVSYYQ